MYIVQANFDVGRSNLDVTRLEQPYIGYLDKKCVDAGGEQLENNVLTTASLFIFDD